MQHLKVRCHGLARGSAFKNAPRPLLQVLFSLGDLVRMRIKLLGQRLVASERRQRHVGLSEFRGPLLTTRPAHTSFHRRMREGSVVSKPNLIATKLLQGSEQVRREQRRQQSLAREPETALSYAERVVSTRENRFFR